MPVLICPKRVQKQKLRKKPSFPTDTSTIGTHSPASGKNSNEDFFPTGLAYAANNKIKEFIEIDLQFFNLWTHYFNNHKALQHWISSEVETKSPNYKIFTSNANTTETQPKHSTSSSIRAKTLIVFLKQCSSSAAKLQNKLL